LIIGPPHFSELRFLICRIRLGPTTTQSTDRLYVQWPHGGKGFSSTVNGRQIHCSQAPVVLLLLVFTSNLTSMHVFLISRRSFQILLKRISYNIWRC